MSRSRSLSDFRHHDFRPLVCEMCPNAFIDHLRVGELNAPLRHSRNLTGQCFRKIDLPVTCGSMSPATWRRIDRYRQFIIGLSKTSLPDTEFPELIARISLSRLVLSFFLLRGIPSKSKSWRLSYSRWGKSESGVLDIAY